MREALERYLESGEENPNQWLLDSIGIVNSGGRFPAIDSDEGRELLHNLLCERRSERAST